MLKKQKRHRHAAADSVKTKCAGTLVGREKEIGKLLLHISNRESLHIYGPEGTGKSALLNWAYDNWHAWDHSLIPIYCRSSRTLRQILLYIAAFLLDYFKHLESVDKFKNVKNIDHPPDIKKLSMRHLRNLIFAYIPQDNFCVMLDHLEYVTPKVNGFLTTLYEKAFVISASRQSWELADYRFKGNLANCLYLIPKLPIENLSRNDAYLLMEHIYGNLSRTIADKASLLKEIFRSTNGNPKMTVEILNKARKQKYIKNATCNLNLIHIDLMMEKPLCR
jgi:hypothetical protein